MDERAASHEVESGREPGLRRIQRIGLGAGLGVFVLLCLLPAPAGLPLPAWRAAAVAVLMALWWMTEAIPIPATALLPLVLFPVLGVASPAAAAAPYGNPLIYLFLGGFLIALGMERWQLHRRLALTIIQAMGTRPARIVAGFMLASAALSMWISNTATAMMMLPIGVSVIELVERPAAGDDPRHGRNFAVALLLGIAYGCSIGGMGTLIGTPTNALLAAFLVDSYQLQLGFLQWMLVALPLVVAGLVLTWLVLTRLVFPLRVAEVPGSRELVAGELAALGPMSTPEKKVAAVFALTAGLWVTQPLLERWVSGLSDTGIAVAGALLLFLLPAGGSDGGRLLDWTATSRLPWGVLLLFGGGLSLAAAINQSGLAGWIGGGVGELSSWPLLAIVMLVALLIVFLTELTSNTATAAAFLPVLASVAGGLGRDPLLLLVPATLAASCAFMLPVATPPNAIVFGSGHISIPQMARAGVVLNLIFWVLVSATAWWLVPLVLGSATS